MYFVFTLCVYVCVCCFDKNNGLLLSTDEDRINNRVVIRMSTTTKNVRLIEKGLQYQNLRYPSLIDGRILLIVASW